MTVEVASSELRSNVAGLLRRVQAGELIILTTRGKPVASLVALEPQQRRWLPRAELVRRLALVRADPGLREDLARLTGETE